MEEVCKFPTKANTTAGRQQTDTRVDRGSLDFILNGTGKSEAHAKAEL
jgi:hypothetical protein